MLGTHTHSEPRTGAAAAFRHGKRSPLEVLKTTKEQYPNADKDLLKIKWREACEDDGEEVVDAVWWHTFTNLHASLERQSRPGPTPEEKAQRAAEAKRRAAEIEILAQEVERRAVERRLTLGFIMPDGRPFAEWGKAECMEHSEDVRRVGEKLGDGLVGEVFKSDDELRTAIES